MSAGMTPPERRGPVNVPVPRPDGAVYVYVAVQFPGGQGVLLSETVRVDPEALSGHARLAADMLTDAYQQAMRTIGGL